MQPVDSYLEKIDPPHKMGLVRIRSLIKKLVPDATEVITYGMPGFQYKKKYLIAYAPFKDHMSIFPGAGAVEAFKYELRAYETSKGTVQFTLERPLSNEIIVSLVQHRLNSI